MASYLIAIARLWLKEIERRPGYQNGTDIGYQIDLDNINSLQSIGLTHVRYYKI